MNTDFHTNDIQHNTNKASTKRIEFVDLTKGFCICLVVILHVFGESAGNTFNTLNLFLFLIPPYFILSGLLFKQYSGFQEFFKKKTNQLLIPFLFTYFIICIPSIILLSKSSLNLSCFWSCTDLKLQLGIDGAVWFLMCLFFQNIIFSILYSINHKMPFIVTSSGVIGIGGYALNIANIHLPLWIDSAMTALPFFLFGYCIRKYSQILFTGITKKQILYLLISILILIATSLYNDFANTTIIVYGVNHFNVNPLCLYLGGITGFYIIFMFAKFIKRLPIFSYIGRYSIVVLLTHLLYLFIIRNILYKIGVNQELFMVNVCIFIFIILLSIPTIYLCIRFLPYWFAQKDLIK